jgi:hypothetical protein
MLSPVQRVYPSGSSTNLNKAKVNGNSHKNSEVNMPFKRQRLWGRSMENV